jgi:hypothetical protein
MWLRKRFRKLVDLNIRSKKPVALGAGFLFGPKVLLINDEIFIEI